jgi:hypothetical protein
MPGKLDSVTNHSGMRTSSPCTVSIPTKRYNANDIATAIIRIAFRFRRIDPPPTHAHAFTNQIYSGHPVEPWAASKRVERTIGHDRDRSVGAFHIRILDIYSVGDRCQSNRFRPIADGIAKDGNDAGKEPF